MTVTLFWFVVSVAAAEAALQVGFRLLGWWSED